MGTGIEAINAYVGQTFLEIPILFDARALDKSRFENLLMDAKTVGVPCEDPVTNGVNAAKPIIDALSDEDRNSIQLLITSTESGLDFGKSLSTYIHDYLNLSTRCRLFEVKQACYGGTAALQMAASFIESNCAPGAKALVISTDVARAAARMTYAEPSQGVAAVAMLLGEDAEVLELDMGANGYYGREIMDTCRPLPEIETGDPDKSLLAYIECLEHAYRNYCETIDNVDFTKTFEYLAFHTPFAGLVKSAHRKLMMISGVTDKNMIEEDFIRRVKPSLNFGTKTGNSYSAAVYVALSSLLSNVDISTKKRIGIYSYGSGSCAEFYSGIITPEGVRKVKEMNIAQKIENRYRLSMAEYEHLIDLNEKWPFGIQNKEVNVNDFKAIYDKQFSGQKHLVLKRVNNFHREYDWS